MPIYEYLCKDCGLEFEYLVRGNQEVACPKCNRNNLKRLMSSFAFNSKDAKGNITSSSSSCSGCTSTNCSTCSR